MEKKYDVIIVGAGPMGIYTAYEFMKKSPNTKVLVIEKGNDIYNRKCPILLGKIAKCPMDAYGNYGCKPACMMTSGFGGCGAFSDGKFNITTEFGGWMNEYIDNDELLDLIKYVDSIQLEYGAPSELTDPNTKEVFEIEKKAISVGLRLQRAQVRHLGTEINLQVLTNIYEALKGHNIDFMFQKAVKDIIDGDDIVKGVILEDGTEIYSDYVVIGVGRPGAFWLAKTMEKHGVRFKNNRVDIGVRVETSDIVMDEINKNLYEGKFVFNTSVGTRVRTFCSNPSGHVVVENHNGVIICNGHSFHDTEMGSDNTNFALLVSHEFSEPFNEPTKYAEEISRLANKLSGGSVLVQRYGDIKQGRRSTYKRIDEGFVRPTLKEAVPGDLSLVLPYKTMQSLIEMIEALDKVTPGIANDHTLFYGVEAKFYSDRIDCDNNFETKIHNLFVGGDGAGITRGLAQSSANGVKIARKIISRFSE